MIIFRGIDMVFDDKLKKSLKAIIKNKTDARRCIIDLMDHFDDFEEFDKLQKYVLDLIGGEL